MSGAAMAGGGGCGAVLTMGFGPADAAGRSGLPSEDAGFAAAGGVGAAAPGAASAAASSPDGLLAAEGALAWHAAVPLAEGPLPCVAYLYDGSTEGLFSAIFDAYANREDPQDFFGPGAYQPRIGQSVRTIPASGQKALRVRRGLSRVGGDAAFRAALHGSLSDRPDAPLAVYRFVRYVMDDYGRQPRSRRGSLMGQLAHPAVGPVAALEREVLNEAHRMKQFLRFRQKENGLWVGVCSPKANVVPLVMEHFAGRFNTQPFAIYDKVHHVAGLSRGGRWRLACVQAPERLADCAAEELMAGAWCAYYDSASIDERYHPELRRQFMPMRLWANITEMSRPPAVRSDACAPLPATSEAAVLPQGAPHLQADLSRPSAPHP